MAQVIEPAFFGASLFMYLAYHFWLFYLRDHLPGVHKRFLVWQTSYRAREVWALEVAGDARDALQTYASHNLRNAITAASFMATTCALIAVQGLFTSFVDANRIQRLRQASDDDVLAQGTWASPALKLALTMGVVLFSFLNFLQSIRLMVHLGFLLRVVPAGRNRNREFDLEEAGGVAARASTCLTLGIRSFYGFIPLVMWAFGSTALLITTVVLIGMLFFTDDIPQKGPRIMANTPGNVPHPSSDVDIEVANGTPAGSGSDRVDRNAAESSRTNTATEGQPAARVPKPAEVGGTSGTTEGRPADKPKHVAFVETPGTSQPPSADQTVPKC